MKEIIELTPVKYSGNRRYLTNIQNYKGKKGIYCKVENDNPHDNFAIAVYTKNRAKEEINIGYVRKYDYIYTEEAEKLYFEWINFDYDEEIKLDENWGKQIKKPIYKDKELKKIVDNINDNNYFYRFDFNADLSALYLIK